MDPAIKKVAILLACALIVVIGLMMATFMLYTQERLILERVEQSLLPLLLSFFRKTIMSMFLDLVQNNRSMT